MKKKIEYLANFIYWVGYISLTKFNLILRLLNPFYFFMEKSKKGKYNEINYKLFVDTDSLFVNYHLTGLLIIYYLPIFFLSSFIFLYIIDLQISFEIYFVGLFLLMAAFLYQTTWKKNKYKLFFKIIQRASAKKIRKNAILVYLFLIIEYLSIFYIMDNFHSQITSIVKF